jgi:hypothetical protein
MSSPIPVDKTRRRNSSGGGPPNVSVGVLFRAKHQNTHVCVHILYILLRHSEISKAAYRLPQRLFITVNHNIIVI